MIEHLLVLSDDSGRRASLCDYAKYRHGLRVAGRSWPNHLGSDADDDVVTEFTELSVWLEEQVQTHSQVQQTTRVLLVMDLGEACSAWACWPWSIDPLDSGLGKPALAAMVVLAYPELHVVFLDGLTTPRRSLGFSSLYVQLMHVAACHTELDQVLDRSRRGYSPLFDPAGLREHLRSNIDAHSPHVVRARRTWEAVVIEDEVPYLLAHGYAGYRFGYRAHLLSTDSWLREVLETADRYPYITLALEDVWLGLPSRYGKSRLLSRSANRDESLTRLAAIPFRLKVTASAAPLPGWRRAPNQWTKHVPKPYGGMFGLWFDSGLSAALGRSSQSDGNHTKLLRLSDELPPRAGDHSSPGRLAAVANTLLTRANAARSDACSPPEYLQIALWALDAKELLGGRPQTMTYQALRLQHIFETRFEAEFSGVAPSFNVPRRLSEIGSEVQALAETGALINAPKIRIQWEINLLHEIVAVLRASNRFEEEHLVQVQLRRLNARARRLEWQEVTFDNVPVERLKNSGIRLLKGIGRFARTIRPGRSRKLRDLELGQLLGRGQYLIQSYVGWLFERPRHFAGAIAVIGSALGLLFWLTCQAPSHHLPHRIANLFFGHPVITLLGLEAPHDSMSGWESGVVWGGVVLGYAHLALFMSYIFSWIWRR